MDETTLRRMHAVRDALHFVGNGNVVEQLGDDAEAAFEGLITLVYFYGRAAFGEEFSSFLRDFLDSQATEHGQLMLMRDKFDLIVCGLKMGDSNGV